MEWGTPAWVAPLGELRTLAECALRIAPLHRSAVWLCILDGAGPAALAAHGRTPWAWLEDVARPVLLTDPGRAGQ